MRPDERAAQTQVERSENIRSTVKGGLKAAAGLGVAALTGGTAAAIAPAISSRVLPFLSQYIPAGLAMKGLSKVNPTLGKFLKKGQEAGLDIKEGIDFIRNKLGYNEEEEKKKAKESRNIIQQYSPELHQFISDEIKKGRTPIQAGALAQNDKRFKSAISKLSKDHKTNWSQIIQGIYGSGETAQTQQMTPQQIQNDQQQQQKVKGEVQEWLANKGQRQSTPEQQANAASYGLQAGQNPPQNGGKGQQALMGLIQQYMQSRGQR